MKTKAIFYDTYSGSIVRCMYAGLDRQGRAQWVVITPGEESKTLMKHQEELGLEWYAYRMLCLCDERASSREVAKVLACVMNNPFDVLELSLKHGLDKMRQLGVWWDDEPLKLSFTIYSNEGLNRSGKYSFDIHLEGEECDEILDSDGFYDLKTLRHWIDVYLNVLEVEAGIKLSRKQIYDTTEDK